MGMVAAQSRLQTLSVLFLYVSGKKDEPFILKLPLSSMQSAARRCLASCRLPHTDEWWLMRLPVLRFTSASWTTSGTSTDATPSSESCTTSWGPSSHRWTPSAFHPRKPLGTRWGLTVCLDAAMAIWAKAFNYDSTSITNKSSFQLNAQ